MHVFLGYTLDEWVAVTVLLGFVFGGCAALIRYFKKSISEPMKIALKDLETGLAGLREDLKESREQRKRNERKLFNNLDEHTKQIYSLDGRVRTLETINQIEKEEK